MTSTRRPPSYSELAKPYWDAAAEGRMVIQHCDACDGAIFPPRPLCPACWSDSVSWREVSGRARVESFSVVHRAPNETFAADVPYVVALVLLDEGPRMMTNIVGCDPDDVAIDMRVRAVYTQYDGFVLPQFEPGL
ncbi:MAG TPA: Zn-ribbon domain-containing OB-fold protein [Gaiellaceae bacterium]|jgi:uncharacterized OB-fold protein|nr:Zn-ribbon domain-containing OB-fold protein [Gaiellaceae bacterium]